MKIVHVNTVWNRCSTGRIAAAIAARAEAAGHVSLAAYGRGPLPRALGVHGIRIGSPVDFALHVFRTFVHGSCGFGSVRRTRGFLRWLDAEKPDLLHLHNLHGFYLHVGLLFEYIRARRIPVVWTLHDCWPFTGHCAFFDEACCAKWRTGCHDCPVHRTAYPYALLRDPSRVNWLAKRVVFTSVPRMVIATPSEWLANIVRQSFLGVYPVEVLPNGIDLAVFRPPEGMSADSCGPKTVLAAANVWEPRKGLPLLLSAADALRDEFRFVVVGLSPRQRRVVRRRHPGVVALGRVPPAELAALYGGARMFANPTLQDNFPTTNLEALACGTPVVAFRSGGSAECLTERCGIGVPSGDLPAFIKALRDLDRRIDIGEVSSETCREQALRYDQVDCFHRYLDLYAWMEEGLL